MHGAHNIYQKCMPSAYSPQKMYMHSCMHAYATVHKIFCHGSYCELILSLARALCRLSFDARPPAGSTKSVAWRCSLKKFVQIHASSWRGRCCGVAQASFDHPRWCAAAGLIQFVYGSHSCWPRTSPSTKIGEFSSKEAQGVSLSNPLGLCRWARPSPYWFNNKATH